MLLLFELERVKIVHEITMSLNVLLISHYKNL